MHAQTTNPKPMPYFIGVDSDGTVFDSMEIKHKRVFQPIAIELWGLESIAPAYCSTCEAINLYSEWRGVNRFQGLALAFNRISETSELAREALTGREHLEDFIRSGGALSYEALASYNESRKHPFLSKVLDWSRRCDALYAEIMKDEGTPTFPRVSQILEKASGQSEVVVISSSSRVTLEKDWNEAGLLPFVTRIEGQEQGNKSRQLNSAVQEGRDSSKALMIGDALSDLAAAQDHGILFYPITPGAESASWERFEAEALERFYKGTYAGEYESSLLSDFHEALQVDTESSVSANH